MFGKPAKEINESDARTMAMRFLGRREYSEHELCTKLKQRGVDSDLAEQVVAYYAELDVVSDQRFAEAFCRSRQGRYYGPVKIRAELRLRGISDELIVATLPRHDEFWRDLALEWLQRRFRGELTQKEKARLYRGGRNRGFSHDHVMRGMDQLKIEN